MDLAHRTVWDLIRARRTAEAAISRTDLVEATGIDDRRVRQIVSELVTKHHCNDLIAAPTGGYYVTETAAARPGYARRCISRAVHELERARRVAGAQVFLEEAGQVRLMLRGAEATQEARNVSPAPSHEPEPELPCTAKLAPGQRKSDNALNGRRCRICSKPLRGRQTVACGDFHRQLLHGRQRAS